MVLRRILENDSGKNIEDSEVWVKRFFYCAVNAGNEGIKRLLKK